MKIEKFYLLLIMVAYFLVACTDDSVKPIIEKENNTTIQLLDSKSSNNKTSVYADNFVYFNRNAGTYWYGDFKNDFGNLSGYSDAEKSRHKVTGSQTLQVKLLKDKVGQSGGTICDISIDKGKQYILKYKVKFEDGFEWTKGGKLPGLGGGAVYAGGQETSGGDGWSFRPVWHFYEGVNNNKPFIAPYAYYVDQPGIYGNEFSKKYTIKDNSWYNIWIHIKMNTKSKNDGKLHMKVNNSTVYYNSSFRWVTKDAGREIDELMWDIFRGGVGSDYMASKDNFIYFDTFVVDKK